MKNRIIYNYEVSFETGAIGNRIRVEQSGYNITDVIKKIRQEYPDAHMFIVRRKRKQQQPIK